MVALLGIAAAAFGQNTQYSLTSLTGGTVSNLFTFPVHVTQLTLTADTTNATTFVFYDNASTSTNRASAAYDQPLQYPTNFTSVYTSSTGVLITNTFSGIFTTSTPVSTNSVERPRVFRTTVPASSQRTYNVNISTVFGLNVLANNDATVETEYTVRK